MASLIKGIPVVLYERTPAGQDDLGETLYTETPVTVPNVLVTPATADAVVSELQLNGHRLAYELYLPKGDAHTWEGCRVEFFGQQFRVYAPPTEYIEALTPLDWNRKVKVERYG